MKKYFKESLICGIIATLLYGLLIKELSIAYFIGYVITHNIIRNILNKVCK